MRIFTSGAESPWSNDLIDGFNTVLQLTVTKTIKAVTCDLGMDNKCL